MLFKSDSTVQPPLHQHITSPFFIFLSCVHKNKKNEEAPKVRKEHGSVGRNMEMWETQEALDKVVPTRQVFMEVKRSVTKPGETCVYPVSSRYQRTT